MLSIKMKSFIITLFLACLFFLFLPISTLAVSEQECRQKTGQDQIDCLKDLINETGKQKESLTNEITKLNANIALTTARIQQTLSEIKKLGDEIDALSTKIETLEASLSHLSSVLLERIVATYKQGEVEPFHLLLTSNGFSDFLTRLKYIRVVQAHDKKVMLDVQNAKDNYTDQKKAREEKKAQQEKLRSQLEGQKITLNSQKIAKDQLLTVTKNNEQNYQQLLAQAQAEYEAIQGIIAGGGQETEVGKVNEGQRIASIHEGASCNSSGTHVHFMVTKDGNAQNPFNYLKSGVDFENCSGSSCGSTDGDQFNPGGDWNWPISPKIKLMQGYGSTWAVKYTWVGKIYSFHNGIDMLSSSSTDVKAVKNGKLFRGFYAGNCQLKYVRVQHDDGGIDTYYLHINY